LKNDSNDRNALRW